MSCFNYAENFLRFVTEAHIVYLALKLCNMDNVDAEPSGVDVKTPADIVDLFKTLCRDIVQTVWLLPSLTHVTSVVDSNMDDSVMADTWCICGQGACCYVETLK